MKPKYLHIISLDVPIPADYGGVIDIYFRAKAIKEIGVKVILHCFEYGRSTHQDFSEIADEVYFYKRRKTLLDSLKSEPFIVSTRKSETLVKRLLKDNHPILMEGHHCAGLLNDSRLKNREKFVRIHNVEWIYYKALSESKTSYWRKLFFKCESKKLKKFDSTLALADGLFCLSTTDLKYYQTINSASYLWPVGCSMKKKIDHPTENYALFHGNLSVAENEKALRWIVDVWVKNEFTMPLMVAGKNPRLDLKTYLEKYDFIELIQNPSNEKMTQLISAAKVNLLITFQSTGVKLKLLNALVQGKRCIVNQLMVEGTDLGRFCEVIDDEETLAVALQTEDNEVFIKKNIVSRMKYLNANFDVLENSQKALKIIGIKTY